MTESQAKDGGIARVSLSPTKRVAAMVFMRVLRKSSYFSRFQVRTPRHPRPPVPTIAAVCGPAGIAAHSAAERIGRRSPRPAGLERQPCRRRGSSVHSPRSAAKSLVERAMSARLHTPGAPPRAAKLPMWPEPG